MTKPAVGVDTRPDGSGFRQIRGPAGAPLPDHLRGEITQSFVEPLGHVSVESSTGESILAYQVVDQAELQAVFDWFYAQAVEIVSLVLDDRGADSGMS